MRAKLQDDRWVKICSRCRNKHESEHGIDGLTTFFRRDRSQEDGLIHYCKPCMSKRDKERDKFPNQRSVRRKMNSPIKYKARYLLNNAIQSGKVARMPCRDCNNPRSQGHHEDYLKPLEVVWLCQRCHHLEHANHTT